jgi:hypothetical protein
MKQKVYNILREKNLDINKYNIEILYNAGIRNIVNNIEFYYDKPYTCESVLKELFLRGVLEQIRKTQSLF